MNALSLAPLASRWRCLVTPPLSGPENMAVDVALMARARRTREAVFRLYTWATPTLSFGRNQTAIGRYQLDRISELGLAVVRRPTGGRAILHRREITYSVTAPATDAVGLKPAYHRINRILEHGLASLGVSVTPANVHAHRLPNALRPTDSPCFATPSEGEMVADGRKLVGSAQWRDDGALLQHGSILVDDDQHMLASLMTDPPSAPIPLPATLSSVMGRAPSIDELSVAMFQAVRALEDPMAEPLHPDAAMTEDGLPIEIFLQNEWTWRR